MDTTFVSAGVTVIQSLPPPTQTTANADQSLQSSVSVAEVNRSSSSEASINYSLTSAQIVASTTPGSSVVSGGLSSAASSPKISHPSTTRHGQSSTQSTTSKPSASRPSPSSHSSNDRLTNGAVAGIVIAVAVAIALLTFLATVWAMRRRRKPGVKQHDQRSDDSAAFALTKLNQHNSRSEPKEPLVTEASNNTSGTFESYIPQSADDGAVQNNVKTLLDQIELHIENFYQSTRGSPVSDADIAVFESPSLPKPLATLLAQTTDAIPILKHALAHSTANGISLTSNHLSSLLPDEFILLPNTFHSSKSGGTAKPGVDQCLSRWRVLTAYIRPPPTKDTSYIAQRDHRIQELVQEFSQAFAPWRNRNYPDEDRMRSLSATLKSAADVGIWMFSQPSTLQFQWPTPGQIGANRIAVVPALVKVTDERGKALKTPQIMLEAVMQRLR